MIISTDKPVVGHYLFTYLAQTETFIYQYLSRFRNINPVVLTQTIANLDQFPFSPIYRMEDLLSCLNRRGSQEWSIGWFERHLRHEPAERRILKRLGIDLLHAHFGTNGYWALHWKRMLQVPLVTTFYGADVTRTSRETVWLERYQELFEEGDLFLVEGPCMRENLHRLGCPLDKIEIQHIAVDLGRIRSRSRSSHPDSGVRILLAGRMIEKKGHVFALRAFAAVVEEYPNARLVIIGDGEMMAQIREEIQNLGITDQVELKGTLDYQSYLSELDQACVLMAPSITAEDGDTEGGAPTVILEAQASGLPVLSTFHADIPYIVENGKSGLLVPERDVDSLADCLRRMISNPELCRAMGEFGKMHVQTHHNIEIEVKKLEQKYFAFFGQDRYANLTADAVV